MEEIEDEFYDSFDSYEVRTNGWMDGWIDGWMNE